MQITSLDIRFQSFQSPDKSVLTGLRWVPCHSGPGPLPRDPKPHTLGHGNAACFEVTFSEVYDSRGAGPGRD